MDNNQKECSMILPFALEAQTKNDGKKKKKEVASKNFARAIAAAALCTFAWLCSSEGACIAVARGSKV